MEIPFFCNYTQKKSNNITWAHELWIPDKFYRSLSTTTNSRTVIKSGFNECYLLLLYIYIVSRYYYLLKKRQNLPLKCKLTFVLRHHESIRCYDSQTIIQRICDLQRESYITSKRIQVWFIGDVKWEKKKYIERMLLLLLLLLLYIISCCFFTLLKIKLPAHLSFLQYTFNRIVILLIIIVHERLFSLF